MDTIYERLTQSSSDHLSQTLLDGAGGVETSVLIMRPTDQRAVDASLTRMKNEYSLKDRLDSVWAVRPIALEREGDQTVLVLEDPGGDSLERFLDAPMDVDRFLGLAVEIATAVGRVHQSGVVHRDIKPAHIFVDALTGAVRITGFGLATLRSHPPKSFDPLEVFAGASSSLALDRTDGTSSSTGTWSDLYSLGVIFYQMLTGVLPFAPSEMKESDHCQTVRRSIFSKPIGPDEIQVSRIVKRLLCNTPEERYQTASGLEYDLRRCMKEFDAEPQIKLFELGTRDVSDDLLISEKLYGRERERTALRAAFDRVVSEKSSKFVVISGCSGIGKSAVVYEMCKSLAPLHSLSAFGKSDEHERDIPYATVARAFQSLVSQILAKGDEEINLWRSALRDALGKHSQLMIALIPKLALIIGEISSASEVSLQDQHGRFQMVFRRLLSVFARSEHPLTLFFDDLQWSDIASLDLIEHLVTHTDVRHLLLIGAFRDSEVNSAHALEARIERLRESGIGVQSIKLMPLGVRDVMRLLADTLRMQPMAVWPLAQFIFDKTAGNPFFCNQFLRALAEQGLLTLDRETRSWSWDLSQIGNVGFTDDVVDLIATRLDGLPQSTLKVLGVLACLGNAVDADTLGLALKRPKDALHAMLWVAVQAGLVTQTEGAYRFLHSRIREVAYALIPPDARAPAHLGIARAFSEGASIETLRENIFEIVNQFERGETLVVAQDEREIVALYNLMAGKRAKEAAAYKAASKYFATGRSLLSSTGWETSYRLTFDLELSWSESLYLTGDLELAEQHLAIAADRAQTIIDAATVTCMRINLYTTLDRSDSAVEAGLQYLARVCDGWTTHPRAEEVTREYEQLSRCIADFSVEMLLDSPLMQEEELRATMDVLTVLTSPALFTDINLFRLVVGRMARLSMKHGNSDGSALAYAWLGSVLSSFLGEYTTGDRFSMLGLNLVEKRGLDRFKARVFLVYAVHSAIWMRPLRTSLEYLRRSFDIAVKSGDLSYATYCCGDVIANRLAAGDPLDEVEQEAQQGLAFARKARFGLLVDSITGKLELIRMFRGSTANIRYSDDTEFNEGEFEQHLINNPQLSIAAAYYWISKLQSSVFVNDDNSAMAAIAKVAPVLWTTPTQLERAEYYYYAALAWATHHDLASPQRRRVCLKMVISHHSLLTMWAESCPTTFASRAALVGAEIARLEGRDFDALRLYEEAIESSSENSFIQNEALAHERAARFCAARGLPAMADAHLRSAKQCYRLWGAAGLVQRLDRIYPQVAERARDTANESTKTVESPVQNLDLATVLKVSQVVSRELVLDKLLDTLIRTALEHAGAERGLLLLCRGHEQRMVAEAVTKDGETVVRLCDETVTPHMLSEMVVQTVFRLQETITLDDAVNEPVFATDPYVRRHHSRSILCLPLPNRSKLTGVLYLENDLTSGVFTPARIAVLRLVASQAAVALENSRLYQELAERESKIRRLIDANIIGISFWRMDGPIFDANDAFLRIVGYDREDLIAGRLNWQAITPPDWRGPLDKEPEYKASGMVQPYEKEYFRKDGTRVPILICLASFDDSRDQGMSFVLDLTERKRSEATLRKMQLNFEHANRVATMGQLAASIAHEVRQPMSATVTNAEVARRWLERQPPDLSKARQSLSRIVRDGNRAVEVIKSIRAFVNKTPPVKDGLDINEAIHDVIEFIRAEIAKNDVTLTLDFAKDLPLVHGDRVQLQQVLINLIINAVEALENVREQERRLSIRTREDQNNQVLIAVQDSGPGLGAVLSDTLFDTFYTTKTSGMGMGLAICRSIVEAHNGKLCARENEPRGAIFELWLPMAGTGDAQSH